MLKLWLISVCAILLFTGCEQSGRITLPVFHAGSLSAPMERMEEVFEKRHPHVDVQRQAYGSAMAIRQVTELGKPADVLGSADYKLIDRMMIEGEEPVAAWNLLFASNGMCIAHNENWPEDAEWPDILGRGDITVGISNPNHDPCGYRSVIAMCLAEENVDGGAGLFDKVIGENSDITRRQEDGGWVIDVPTDPAARGRLKIRPKETDLIALLNSGAIDCMLIYRSVAVEQGLDYVALPPEVNLAAPDMNSLYESVRLVMFADRRDKSIEVSGSSITYGLTVPTDAPHPDMAEKFVDLVLSEEGSTILKECGLKPLSPRYSRKSKSQPRKFQSPDEE